jgi:hypothetical protein
VIFRTLFSIPIEDETAAQVFSNSAPISGRPADPEPCGLPAAAALVSALCIAPTKATRAGDPGLITGLTRPRAPAIAAGTAPDDLATKIMTTPDPVTGAPFHGRRDGRSGGDLLSGRA